MGQHSGDYAPYPPPPAPQDYSNQVNPGYPPGGLQQPGTSSAYIASGYVENPNQQPQQKKDVVSKFTSALKGIAAKGGEKAGNLTKYISSGPSIAGVAVGRASKGIQLFVEGGQFNVFRTTFGAARNEELLKTFVCHLSTSSGPVSGTLYLSNLKFAFCSDREISYSPAPGHQASSFYKVMLPLERVRAVNPAPNQEKPEQPFIQADMSDGHEFWFLGFMSYDKAVKNMQEIHARFRSGAPHLGGAPPDMYQQGFPQGGQHPSFAQHGGQYPQQPGPPQQGIHYSQQPGAYPPKY